MSTIVRFFQDGGAFMYPDPVGIRFRRRNCDRALDLSDNVGCKQSCFVEEDRAVS